MPAGRTQQLQKKETSAEYRVPGSREIGFESHPSAALQYVVGGLVPENGDGAAQGLRDFREGLQAPVDTGEAINAHLDFFRTAIEDWKRLVRRIVRGGRLPNDTLGLIASVEGCRAILETASLDAASMLAVADKRLRECAERMSEGRFEVHLALPADLDGGPVTRSADIWRRALTRLGAFRLPQDPEMPLLMARADAIVDEITESLKQIARCARWLWTNEPQTDKVTEMLQWTFDLRCECLDLSPTLTCLQTPLAIWAAGETGDAGDNPPAEDSSEQTAPLS